ncbi:Serine/threonine-protein kinase STN8, chloroplastic [Vitis vinifera]|uniref:Serine/threonine-protein kinase STN8, chloroplastic n=1 Tax=Vitis vinifera TaxID=29760 RepID=A0A438IVE4_VITVI|nr:Serine/threonine-protein kinase STN8, chloroplastic [Vitis vinifera]
MASLLSPAATTFQQQPKRIWFSFSKPISQIHLSSFSNRFKTNPARCNAFFDNISENVVELDQSLSSFPFYRSGYAQFQRITEELPEMEKWGILVFAGLTWIYLTARPGVLMGAIDSYLLAPLQLGLDSLTGRRNLKRTDFVVGNRLGEGSFGVVYSGVLVPKNVSVEERPQKRGTGQALQLDGRFKEKVILKKVKVGVQGAEECGDFEEWFNYRLSRAAPETCAEFLGSFIADQTNSQFTKVENGLSGNSRAEAFLWSFKCKGWYRNIMSTSPDVDWILLHDRNGHGDRDLADYMKDRNFPLNLESTMFGRVLQGLEDRLSSSILEQPQTSELAKNYVPNRGLLDPDYCPPELYVLPEETPTPPPEPIAAFLSPILWQLNSPDLFDMYSAGIVLMQMAVPSLRSTAGLKNFNLELKTVGYDLKRWREYTRFRPDLTILDLDSGRGWDLATKLISERGSLRRGRLSAAAALRHPYFLLGGDQAAAVLSKLSLSK